MPESGGTAIFTPWRTLAARGRRVLIPFEPTHQAADKQRFELCLSRSGG